MKHAVAYALVALLGLPVLIFGVWRGMELIAGAGFLMLLGGVAGVVWYGGLVLVAAVKRGTANERARVRGGHPSGERLW